MALRGGDRHQLSGFRGLVRNLPSLTGDIASLRRNWVGFCFKAGTLQNAPGREKPPRMRDLP